MKLSFITQHFISTNQTKTRVSTLNNRLLFLVSMATADQHARIQNIQVRTERSIFSNPISATCGLIDYLGSQVKIRTVKPMFQTATRIIIILTVLSLEVSRYFDLKHIFETLPK